MVTGDDWMGADAPVEGRGAAYPDEALEDGSDILGEDDAETGDALRAAYVGTGDDAV